MPARNVLGAVILWSAVCALLGGCAERGVQAADTPPSSASSAVVSTALPSTVALRAAALSTAASSVVPSTSSNSEADVVVSAEERGLRARLRLLRKERIDRIPLRVFELTFSNMTAEPIRIYMPASEPFRGGISDIIIVGDGAPLAVPEPHPHGYVVTERDFPLLAPGQTLSFEQAFTLEPMASGTRTERLQGFAAGTRATIHWSYSNEIKRWQGGVQTLDGPTRAVFGGGDIPYIWLGELELSVPWTVP